MITFGFDVRCDFYFMESISGSDSALDIEMHTCSPPALVF